MQKIFIFFILLMGLGIGACVPATKNEKISENESIKTATTTVMPAEIISAPTLYPITSERTKANPENDLLKGVGILGDSFYDEYQADDARGGEYHAITFNAVEILARTRNFNLGPWGSWGEPRRSGYEYNWARSGATSQDLIDQGQHTGVADQIREGKVTFVYIGIGANDFSPYYRNDYDDIYSGRMSDQKVNEKIQTAVTNVTLAVDTVLKAGAKGVIVTLFTQWELDPIIGVKYPDASRRLRVAKAIDAVNQGILGMAKEKGIVVFDQNAFGMTLLPKLEKGRYLNVGGKMIDFLEYGDAPNYSRLADKQHIGTVLSGVVANGYFIQPLNTLFGLHIPLLSDEEILGLLKTK